MIRLLVHHLRRTWTFGTLCAVALFLFHALALKIFKDVWTGPNAMVAGQFTRAMPKWMLAAMGIEGPMNTLPGFLSITWQHPLVLGLMLAMPVVTCTGLLAGDVERRTMAMLLARPLGRLQVYASVATMAALWPALGAAAAWAGIEMGARWTGQSLDGTGAGGGVPVSILAMTALNLFALSMAVAGYALLVSAASDTRGGAGDLAFWPVLIMYVGNFLVQIWPAAAPAADWMLFRHFQPGRMLLRGIVEPRDMWILAAVSAVGLIAGAVVFRRRDLAL